MIEILKKYKVYIIVFSIFLIVSISFYLLFGTGTFAVERSNMKDTFFSTLKLDEEAYGETVFDASKINLRPILDKNLKSSIDNIISINFWVGGNKDNDADEPIYDIALAELEVDCNLLSPYIKWVLYKNGEELSNGSLDYKFDTIKDGRLVLTPIQQDLAEYNKNKNSYDYYEFYMWLSDSCQEDSIALCKDVVNQNNLVGKKLSGRIEVELYSKSKLELKRKPSDIIDTSTCINN